MRSTWPGTLGALLLAGCYVSHPEELAAPGGGAGAASLGTAAAPAGPSVSGASGTAATGGASGTAATGGAPVAPVAGSDEPRAGRPGLDPGVGRSMPTPPMSCVPGEQRTDLCAQIQDLCGERGATATTTCQSSGEYSQCTCQLPPDRMPHTLNDYALCFDLASVELREDCADCMCTLNSDCVDTLVACDDACWEFLRCAIPCIGGDGNPISLECLVDCFSTGGVEQAMRTMAIPGCVQACQGACSPALRGDTE